MWADGKLIKSRRVSSPPSRCIPCCDPQGRDIRTRRHAGNQVVGIGQVRKALLVFVAAAPLPRPRPTSSRGRPATQLLGQLSQRQISHGDSLRPTDPTYPDMETPRAEPPQCEALLLTPVGTRRFVIRATHERGVGVPSSRSFAAASHEASSAYARPPTTERRQSRNMLSLCPDCSDCRPPHRAQGPDCRGRGPLADVLPQCA
jgi:hypothetical protein